MFINLENGKLKLYDLKINDNLYKIAENMIFESPNEYCVVISSNEHYYNGKLLNEGKDMAYWVNWKETGNKYDDIVEYSYSFVLYHLPHIYTIIDRLKKQDYTALVELCKFINNDYVSLVEQIKFDKYREQILDNIELIELVNEDCLQVTRIYDLLLSYAEGDLKGRLESLSRIVKTYHLDIEKMPRLIKK